MESLLGFKETNGDLAAEEKWCGHKLVPWISWDEWNFVKESLFSSSSDSIASALGRITAWRSRGCLPVVIEVTASIIEIQQKDPFFRAGQIGNASDSEEVLAMLYCMAIMRLVNGVVEKTRKRRDVSIAVAANAINIPRMLIDIRHEGSHRDLPSLRLVRLASIKALDWLKSYYWEPQKNAIPFQRDVIGSIRKEIRSRVRALALCLKTKQAIRSTSLPAKGKLVKHCERFCGRSKFLSLMSGTLHLSRSAGSMKKVSKTLKNLVSLHSSYPSEVASVLLEFLLKASDFSSLVEVLNDNQVNHGADNLQCIYDDWKPLIGKLSNKEPELLLTLLKAVLKMIEAQDAIKYENGARGFMPASRDEVHHVEKLYNLFEWLVGILKGLKHKRHKVSAAEPEHSSAELHLPKATLDELVRKCLLVSSFESKQLMSSLQILARMTGNGFLVEKLDKVFSLDVSEPNENFSVVSSEDFLNQQAECIREAAAKLDFVKFHCKKNNVVSITDGVLGDKSRWILAESWNPCPIGMLPCDVGSSGQLPILECDDKPSEGVPKSSEAKEHWELNRYSGKRKADSSVELVENPSFKKTRETEGGHTSDGKDDTLSEGVEGKLETEKGHSSDGKDDTLSEGVKGKLLIDGVWKKIREEELLAIASAIRVLI